MESCPERLELSKKIADAIAETHRAKQELDSARERRVDLAQLQIALANSRTVEREAVRALVLHAKSHGCKAVIS
jgi:hypothetical protein